MVPHANKIHEDFDGKGLQLIGVTSESKGDTEPWIEDKGVQYPYVYDRGGLHQELGLRGYPAAVLVDAYGTVVWKGHPSSVSSGMLKDAAKGALKTPAWEWPEEAAPLKEALATGKLAEAIAAAGKLDLSETKKVGKFLQKTVEKRVESLEALIFDRDIESALAAVDSLEFALEGLPELQDVEKLASEIAESDKLQKALADQRELEEIAASLPQRGGTGGWSEDDAEDALKKVEKMARSYKKKAIGRRAEEVAKALKALVRELG